MKKCEALRFEVLTSVKEAACEVRSDRSMQLSILKLRQHGGENQVLTTLFGKTMCQAEHL